MFSKCDRLHKNRDLGSLLVRSIQVCVNTMRWRNDNSNDLREPTVAAHQSGNGYKVIFKLFAIYHAAARKITHKWKTFKTVPRREHPRDFTPRSDRTLLGETKEKKTTKRQELHVRPHRPRLHC